MTERRNTITRMSVSGAGAGVYHVAHGSDPIRKIRFDGHAAYGGRERALSPLDHVLAALTACYQITAAMIAQQHGVLVGQFAVDLTAEFDYSVLVTGVGRPGGFQSVNLSVKVETELDEQGLAELGMEVERRCPIHQLFVAGGVDVRTVWRKSVCKIVKPMD